MSRITTHVLDTARGCPAAGVGVRLERRSDRGAWSLLGEERTDGDGRARSLLGPDERLVAGIYRLVFATAGYFAENDDPGFFPEVSVVFTVRDPSRPHHVPLLLSPYGYSTYRGS